jgi:hypothetical protein
MTERLDDVWTARDYPVLREITKRIDAGETPTVDMIRDALGYDDQTLQLAVKALDRRHLVDGIRSDQAGIVRFTDVSAEAYFLTGLHPSGDDAVSDLADLLRQAADEVDDPDEKTRLRRAADSVLNVSRDVMVGVMTAYATKYGVH